MVELKTYSILNTISKSIYVNPNDNQETINRLKSMSPKMNESISNDFRFLFNEDLDITNISYFYNDETYRQSATSCIIEAKLRRDKNLSFLIECLVDHSRVLIKVKDNPNLFEFNSLINQIEKAYNTEGFAELNDINRRKQQMTSNHIKFWNKIKDKLRF